MTFRYINTTGTHTFNVDLGTEVVRLGSLSSGFVESADMGQVGTGAVPLDDPDGTLDILGLQYLQMRESAAPGGDDIAFYGYIGDRTITRGDAARSSLRTDAARVWATDVMDFNVILTMRQINKASGKRPRESASARLTWLLALGNCPVHDYGFVTYPSHMMDANDYTGQTFADVLADCAAAVAYNFFALYDQSGGGIGLWFMDPGGSAYSTSAKVSNVLSEIDGTTVFEIISPLASLKRSAGRIASGVRVAYSGGAVYLTRSTTSDKFAVFDHTSTLANVKTAATAKVIATKELDQSDGESDRLSMTIRVPIAHVNDIRAGHRMGVQVSHFPGYEDYRWCRVMSRAVLQDEESDEFYNVALELTPQVQPTGPIFTGTAFAALVYGDSGGAVTPTLVYEYTGDAVPGGWYPEPTIGPLSVVESGAPFLSITTSSEMVVRIECSAMFASVVGEDYVWGTIDITRNGGVIGSQTIDQHGSGLRPFTGIFGLDIHDVVIEPGDVLSFAISTGWVTGGFFQNVGVNGTVFRVGRGTVTFTGGGGTWVGP